MDKKSGSGTHTGSGTEIEIWPLDTCQFAYTIGGNQPVRCTWISDQPLFYADYPEATEEDAGDYLDDPILQALERDIADMREKATAYDKVAGNFAEADGETSRLFREDADFVAHYCATAADGQESLLATLHQSRLASQFLSFARLHNVTVKESLQISDATYDRVSGTILVRADLDFGTKILLLARELRRMWQHRNGVGIHPLTLHPDYAVLINRAQTADLLVSMVRIAWELQLAGHKDAWMRIENGPMADIGRAFAREAIADFRSINEGIACRTAFETWFLSERCRKADRTLIQQMLADYQGYVFGDNPEASRLIALDILQALGKVPFGSNYLMPIATTMIVDPVFTDVRDRSNANFLWFIKFERSFTTAEKEVPAIEEKTLKKKAEVIAFPQAEKQKLPQGRKDTDNGVQTPADVVLLTLQ